MAPFVSPATSAQPKQTPLVHSNRSLPIPLTQSLSSGQARPSSGPSSMASNTPVGGSSTNISAVRGRGWHPSGPTLPVGGGIGHVVYGYPSDHAL